MVMATYVMTSGILYDALRARGKALSAARVLITEHYEGGIHFHLGINRQRGIVGYAFPLGRRSCARVCHGLGDSGAETHKRWQSIISKL